MRGPVIPDGGERMASLTGLAVAQALVVAQLAVVAAAVVAVAVAA